MATYRANHIQWPVTLPQDPFTAHNVCLPRELVPTVLGALEHIAIADRYGEQINGIPYVSYIRGVQYMIVEGCSQGIDRLYRLIDSIYTGNEYSYSLVDGVETITPAIPPVPPVPGLPMETALFDLRGLLGQGVLGEAVASNYPVSEDVLTVLKQIRDNAGGWTDEEKLQLIQGVLQVVAAL